VNTIEWLVDSDPAIRWQAMRDLTDASPAAVASERARVAHEGLGAEILARQNEDGAWRRPDAPTWLSTLFTLLLLRSTGIDPTDPAAESAVARLEKNMRWSCVGCWDLRAAGSGGNGFFEGEVEPCINGGVLALGGYFGHPTKVLAQRLIGEQLEDGGWNCEAPKSVRSSFHTTICVLEGLLEYERAVGGSAEAAAARKRAEEYLLSRVLMRRLSTGGIIDEGFLKLAFPPRYMYDVLRALDYFRGAALLENGRPDARLSEAVDVVKSKQQPDGRWLLDRASDEALAVPFDEVVGEPSRWNTLRVLRVLRWYEEARG
jgi:hypothetical protein